MKFHSSTLLPTTTCKFLWCYKIKLPSLSYYKVYSLLNKAQSCLELFLRNSTTFYHIEPTPVSFN